MSPTDDPRPDRPTPAPSDDGPAGPSPEAGLADYRDKLRRSLAEIDAALESNLPTRAGDAAGPADGAAAAREPETSPDRPTRRAAAGEWDEPAVVPYLTATLLAVTAMTVLVLATTLPAAGVFQAGLTFLAVAMVVRRLEDAPRNSDNPVLSWLHDRAVQLEGKFGVEFYGIAALTSFIRAEADVVTDLSLSGLLSNPVGTLISWFVSALIESIMNVVWASLWWFELMQQVDGLPLLAAIIGAGWLVWRVLDITPDPEEG